MHGVISHQTGVTRAGFMCHHHGVAHAVAQVQDAFDFAKLDAEAAYLYLPIVTRQVFKVTVRQPARQVAGAIESRAGLLAERVFAETFGGQFRAVQVAECDACATDVDLADHTHRHRLAPGVKHIDPHVGIRLANRQTQGVRQYIENFVAGGTGGALGRAIAVEQAYLSGVLPDPTERGRISALAATHDHAQACQGLGNQPGIQVEQGGRTEHHRHCMAFEQGGKGCRLKQH